MSSEFRVDVKVVKIVLRRNFEETENLRFQFKFKLIGIEFHLITRSTLTLNFAA